MTIEQAIEVICNQSLATLEGLDEAGSLARKALNKQNVIKGKIEWLKSFSPSDTISIGEVINAFEDCEVEEC